MEKDVSITLRLDRDLGKQLFEVEGEVEKQEDIVTLLAYMATLIKEATKYGGKWVASIKLREINPRQIAFTFAFPNTLAKEQFYEELQKGGKKTVP